ATNAATGARRHPSSGSEAAAASATPSASRCRAPVLLYPWAYSGAFAPNAIAASARSPASCARDRLIGPAEICAVATAAASVAAAHGAFRPPLGGSRSSTVGGPDLLPGGVFLER